MAIHSSGQTVLSFPHIEGSLARKEVKGGVSRMGNKELMEDVKGWGRRL